MANRLPIARQVALAGDALRGPFRKEILREAADTLFGEVRASNRAIAGPNLQETVTTDGVQGRAPEDMRVGGQSVLRMGRPSDFLPKVMEILEAASPRGRSNSKPEEDRYVRSHVVLVDGQEIGPPFLLPPAWRRIVVVSLSPYTRKIERGLSAQRPDGVYEAVVFPRVEKLLAETPFDVSFAWVADVTLPFGRRRRSRRAKTPNRKIYNPSRKRIPAVIIQRAL